MTVYLFSIALLTLICILYVEKIALIADCLKNEILCGVKYANDIVVVVVIAIYAAASWMTTFGQYFVTSVNVLYVLIVQIPVIIIIQSVERDIVLYVLPRERNPENLLNVNSLRPKFVHRCLLFGE